MKTMDRREYLIETDRQIMRVVCLCCDAFEEVIAERKYQLLAFGCAIGWLCSWSWSLVPLAICLMYIYALSVFVGAYLDAYLDSSRSLEHHIQILLKTKQIWLDRNKFLIFGFYLGGLSLGFYVRAIYLTYFLFLYGGKTQSNHNSIWVVLDLILTNLIGSLFLECYRDTIYWGCIVLWICYKLDNQEGSPSKLALWRLMMLFISEKSKENKGDLPAVDSSAHPQPKDHNAFRPQNSSEPLTANTFPQDNQKKTRKPSKVPPIKGKSIRNDSKDESGSSESACQQDDNQRHRRRHGDDKDDEFLCSCHSADFNSTVAESLQVMAGQNSNVNGTQNIRDVNIYNFCGFSSYSSVRTTCTPYFLMSYMKST